MKGMQDHRKLHTFELADLFALNIERSRLEEHSPLKPNFSRLKPDLFRLKTHDLE